jgi:DNA gyrase subunit B
VVAVAPNDNWFLPTTRTTFLSATRQKTTTASAEDIDSKPSAMDSTSTTKINGASTTATSSLPSTSSSSSYNANQITVLTGLDPVRKRPGMYIGSTGVDGLHHLVWEVIDNSVDEALAGHANCITCTLEADGSCTIVDNGRGIPTDVHPVTGQSALETVLTVLHAGGKFHNDDPDDSNKRGGYRVSGGLHGVGISVVNALSEQVKVHVHRNDKEYSMTFHQGIPTPPQLKVIDDASASWVDAEVNAAVTAIVAQHEDHIKSPASLNKNSKKRGGRDNKKGDDNDDDDDDDVQSQAERLAVQRTNLELLQQVQQDRRTGTTVNFLPDINVFKGGNGQPSIALDPSRLHTRMEEIAYLNAGLVLALIDKRGEKKTGRELTAERNVADADDYHDDNDDTDAATPMKKNSKQQQQKGTDKVQVFYHAGGLAEYVERLCETKTPLFTVAANKKSTRKSTVSSTTGTDPLAGLLSADGSTILCSGSFSPPGRSSITVSLALRWSSDMYTESILSFCNNIRTKDGGSHVDSFKTCLTRSVNSLVKKLGIVKASSSSSSSSSSNKDSDTNLNLPGDFIREGLTAIVSVSVADPEFEGQTKGRLGNPEVRLAIDAIMSQDLVKVFEFHPELLQAIHAKASAAQAAANAARAARDLVRRKTLLTSTVLPGKLSDCASATRPEDAELFLVEGDSAAGSAKQGRDRRTQAILPLRGKILNIERASTEKIYQNNELQSLISALGLGVKGGGGEDGSLFDSSSLRYGRIIIMTDADVDGAHIRVLLLTFFYRYQRELFERGHVYIAQPPLYKITIKKRGRNRGGSGAGRGKPQEFYAFDEAEKNRIIREEIIFDDNEVVEEEEAALATEDFENDDKGNDNENIEEEEEYEPAMTLPSVANRDKKKDDLVQNAIDQGFVTLQRFKGLGEMMPEQLWATTMDPTRRTLLRVTVDDAEMADQTLSILMGDSVAPRRKFIRTNAGQLTMGDLDV